ncbi:putative SWIB/MDM2 domain-containing transcription activation complex protein [Hamiltosporidium magnivora]|uniref:Putative SWIB/MDM2 domain-containing transcription activation complex protein n=1 Tax=Hamiltosporidium magnivora TaxID=148818 RepID=A0A4Q9KT97_9MICR|nr:putative SWIB/MDM2 domain-containing transcription activation complex protein [Hamiltosporidium magnivora]
MMNLYNHLKKMEKLMDNAALKRKLMIEDSHCSRLKCIKTLRIFISISLNPFLLKIEGRVINDYKNNVTVKTSALLKRIYVEFNNTEQKSEDIAEVMVYDNKDILCPPISEIPIDHIKEDIIDSFEWIRSDKHIDGFELKTGKTPNSIQISFQFDNSINKYKVSQNLAEVINRHTDSKSEIILETWKYIRLNRLIGSKGKDIVVCDDKLKKCFDCDTFDICQLSMYVDRCLIPLDYLTIDVPVTNGYTRVFDVRMECDDLVDFPIIYTNKTILALDRKINDILELIKKTEERKELLEKFAQNPKKFIDEWIVLQSKDLNVIEDNPDFQTDFFYQPIVQETIYSLLQNYK